MRKLEFFTSPLVGEVILSQLINQLLSLKKIENFHEVALYRNFLCLLIVTAYGYNMGKNNKFIYMEPIAKFQYLSALTP